METLSPMAVDVVMESPRVQSEDLLPQQNAGRFNRSLSPFISFGTWNFFFYLTWQLLALFF